jgi:hypothetical protein
MCVTIPWKSLLVLGIAEVFAKQHTIHASRYSTSSIFNGSRKFTPIKRFFLLLYHNLTVLLTHTNAGFMSVPGHLQANRWMRGTVEQREFKPENNLYLKNVAFWDVTPRGSCTNRCFVRR